MSFAGGCSFLRGYSLISTVPLLFTGGQPHPSILSFPPVYPNLGMTELMMFQFSLAYFHELWSTTMTSVPNNRPYLCVQATSVAWLSLKVTTIAFLEIVRELPKKCFHGMTLHSIPCILMGSCRLELSFIQRYILITGIGGLLDPTSLM